MPSIDNPDLPPDQQGGLIPSVVTGVTLTPPTVSLTGLTNQQFSWSVVGLNAPSQAVVFTLTGPGGITNLGLFTAPSATDSAQTTVVTATSAQDPSFAATATVTTQAISAGGGVIVRFMNPTIVAFDGGCSAAGNSATNIKARVGDSFAISLTVVNSDDQDQSAGIEGYTVTGSTYNAGTAVSTAIACPVGEASRGSVSYPLQPDDVAVAGRLSLYIDITNGVDRRRLGPVTIIVSAP